MKPRRTRARPPSRGPAKRDRRGAAPAEPSYEPDLVGTFVPLTRLAAEGRQVGRLADGRVAFATGFVPGDTVTIERARAKKNYVEIDQATLASPSPHRVEPICADAVACGGCDVMALDGESQARAKLALVNEALVRLGGLGEDSPFLVRELIRAETLGYRCRVRLATAGGRVGFFARNSHELIEVRRCHVTSAPLWDVVLAVRELFRDAGNVPGLEFVEARLFPGQARASVYLGGRGDALEANTVALSKRLEEHFVVRAFDAPAPRVDDRLYVTDDVYTLPPVGGFCQVHPSVNRLLVERVLARARASGARTFFDAYSGSGNFSLPLLARGLSGVGVESSRDAVVHAVHAASAQGLGGRLETGEKVARGGAEAGGAFVVGEAAHLGAVLAKNGRRFDLVVVDPPRAGAGALVPALAELTARELVMVSCDPATCARDLRTLCESGFSLDRIEAFDMFSATHHVELVCVLRRG